MIKMVVHTFNVGDVEDPFVYAAEPIWKWENTEQGKWVMAHATETPSFRKEVDTHIRVQVHYSCKLRR